MWLTRYLLLAIAVFFSTLVNAQTVIKVGGYEFPPFVNTKSNEGFHGATLDFINALNKAQDDYVFEFFLTSPKRRYLDFSEGRFDVMLFENITWGWADHPVEVSNTFMQGREVYIAFNREGRDQTFFDDLGSKRMVGILGYHYGFANFNADESFLANRFDVLLSTDHFRNIQLILVNRPELAEIAVVTRSFLSEYLSEHPEHKKDLLISKKMDQEYHHSILVRNKGAISVERVNKLLSQLDKDGFISRLKQRYGILDKP